MMEYINIMMAIKVITLRVETKSQLSRIEDLRKIFKEKTYNKTILKLIEIGKL